MVWLWVGVGAAITIVASILFALIIKFIDDKATAKRIALRNRQYASESAMVTAVQNTIAEMFDTVRRTR